MADVMDDYDEKFYMVDTHFSFVPVVTYHPFSSFVDPPLPPLPPSTHNESMRKYK